MDPSSYTYPQKPPSSRRPSRSSHSHQAPRLGAIAEDGAVIQPDLPPRAHNRPLQRMFHLGFPPVYGAHGEKTPEYGEDFHNFNDVKGPKGENFQDLRHNRHITKRGGWKRLVIVAVVVLAVVLGLGIGLGVGLSKKKNRYDISLLESTSIVQETDLTSPTQLRQSSSSTHARTKPNLPPRLLRLHHLPLHRYNNLLRQTSNLVLLPLPDLQRIHHRLARPVQLDHHLLLLLLLQPGGLSHLKLKQPLRPDIHKHNSQSHQSRLRQRSAQLQCPDAEDRHPKY